MTKLRKYVVCFFNDLQLPFNFFKIFLPEFQIFLYCDRFRNCIFLLKCWISEALNKPVIFWQIKKSRTNLIFFSIFRFSRILFLYTFRELKTVLTSKWKYKSITDKIGIRIYFVKNKIEKVCWSNTWLYKIKS